MRGVIAAIGLLAACDAVYDLRGRGEDAAPADDAGLDALVDGPGAHDEDHDSILDADDNCPGIANSEQYDDDHDLIGDSCDPDPLVQNHRLLFDPFIALDTTQWTPNTEWNADGETVGPEPNQPAADGFRLTHKSVEVVEGAAWSITVGIDLPTAPETYKFIGIHPTPRAPSPPWFCVIYFQTGLWNVTSGGQAVPTEVFAPTILRTTGVGSAASEQTMCEVRNAEFSNALLQPVPYPLLPQLWTQTPVRFQFIDVIQ